MEILNFEISLSELTDELINWWIDKFINWGIKLNDNFFKKYLKSIKDSLSY